MLIQKCKRYFKLFDAKKFYCNIQLKRTGEKKDKHLNYEFETITCIKVAP